MIKIISEETRESIEGLFREAEDSIQIATPCIKEV
jgi:hypothetical protein